MKISRWTIGLGLAAAVGLFGLVEASASPFSMFFLADDLGNHVSGTAPEASEWENDGGDSDSSVPDRLRLRRQQHQRRRLRRRRDTGDGDSGGRERERQRTTATATGNGNNGHGNNEDGVDSSNPGNSKDGPRIRIRPCDDEMGNNGHGNNEDGVDSSNPGNSKAGEDSDPTVDDEMSKGDSGNKDGKKGKKGKKK